MRKWLILLALFVAAPSIVAAETYYCVPKDGGYLCKPVDFEHRTFEYGEDKTIAEGNKIYFRKEQRSFRCYGKGETYKCLPFDNGAMMLETPHSCPEQSKNPWGYGGGFILN